MTTAELGSWKFTISLRMQHANIVAGGGDPGRSSAGREVTRPRSSPHGYSDNCVRRYRSVRNQNDRESGITNANYRGAPSARVNGKVQFNETVSATVLPRPHGRCRPGIATTQRHNGSSADGGLCHCERSNAAHLDGLHAAGKGPWPAVLVIHGGLFLGGDANESGRRHRRAGLAAAGYVAYAINYRLAPPGRIPGQRSIGRFPDQYNDVHLAVQAARDDYRSNGKVGAVGGSAGATHAVWVAATGTAGQDRLDAAVGISGAYDFSDFSPIAASPFHPDT